LVFVLDGPAEYVPDGAPKPAGTGPVHFEHHPAVVDTWTVNGEHNPTVSLAAGTWARARFINASNGGYVDLRGAQLRLIGSDQGLLPARVKPDSIVLAPGDRVDLEWLIGSESFALETAPYTLNGGPALTNGAPSWSAAKALLNVAVTGSTPAPPEPAFDWTFETPTPDPGHTDIVYTLTGSDSGGEWTINGERFPDITIETVPLGETRVIEIRNLSRTEHPFHIHGHGFEVLSVNGKPPKWRQFEDTINVRIRERVRLRLVANNPGDWMTHCHILPHADTGMMTVLRVDDAD
jgi:FtsP/CotA-like multicopper oxidase with cupredoxin domain